MHYLINARFLAAPLNAPADGPARVGREMLTALIDALGQRGPERRPNLEIAAPPGAAIPGAAALGIGLKVGPHKAWREQVFLPWTQTGATIVNFCNSAPILAWRSIVWMHDANAFEAPEAFELGERLWRQSMLHTCVLRRFSVITVSHSARRALIAHGADPARTSVISNGGDHILRQPADASVFAAHGLEPDNYVFVAGSRAQYKNMPFALRALLERLPQEVKIAAIGLHQDAVKNEDAETLPVDPRLKILPVISDAQLRALYEKARCVVIPSSLEGFSLPAAEAMWCSAPLVLCNRSALPEIGGQAAFYFEPNDAEGLVQSVIKASEAETRTKLLNAASIQREKFRWRASARQFLDVYLTR